MKETEAENQKIYNDAAERFKNDPALARAFLIKAGIMDETGELAEYYRDENYGKAPVEKPMIQRRTWKEFSDKKLLWWINRILHTFGWAIVINREEDGTITDAYPAKVTFRGFPEASEEAGFEGIAKLIKDDE